MSLLRWGSFYDPESEVSHYEICLGNAQEECNEIDYVPVGLNTTYTFNALELRHNEEYYVTVKVTNIVGISTKILSNGVKIDLTPPEPVTGGRFNSDMAGMSISTFNGPSVVSRYRPVSLRMS